MEKINLEDYKNENGHYDLRGIPTEQVEQLSEIYKSLADDDNFVVEDADEMVTMKKSELDYLIDRMIEEEEL